MKNKKESLVLGNIIRKIAPRLGATTLIEPVWGIAGQITFKNGKRSYFRYNTVDLNPMGGSEIAADKDHASFFMEQMGYPVVPDSKTFFSKEWATTIGLPKRSIDAGYRYAKRLGFPVVVKPNDGSLGSGVAFVHTKREFYAAMRPIFTKHRVALVQRIVQGNDYRLVVLDNRVISAYQRIPLNVVGDGKRSIRQLLQEKQRMFTRAKRDTQIKIDDPRIKIKLRRAGRSLSSVPSSKERVFLLDNANLSTGGDSLDVTEHIHPDYRKMAVQLTKDMGLRLCGVDLMVDGLISEKPGRYWILEINSSPGLDHYAKTGRAQEKIVEDLYTEVLKSMER